MKIEYGFESDEAKAFPPMVIVDVTNVCNMQCTHCPHREIVKSPSYKPSFMEWKLHKKIIDEVSENNIILLRYASDGESLLHPRFLEMIEYAKSKDVSPVNLTTNGLLLDEKTSERLLKAGIDVIDVSIDAFTKDSYEKIRVNSDFERVKKNTLNLIKLRNELNAPTKIMASIVEQPLVQNELNAFKRFWKPKVDLVLIRKFCNMCGLVKGKNRKPRKKRWPCPQFWKRITINCHGKMRFCVEDWHNKTVIGDVSKQSIKKVWNGKKYGQLRKIQLEGSFDKTAFCEHCTDWVNSRWDYGYDYAIKKIFEEEG